VGRFAGCRCAHVRLPYIWHNSGSRDCILVREVVQAARRAWSAGCVLHLARYLEKQRHVVDALF
jgi:hypothetical protein